MRPTERVEVLKSDGEDAHGRSDITELTNPIRKVNCDTKTLATILNSNVFLLAPLTTFLVARSFQHSPDTIFHISDMWPDQLQAFSGSGFF